MNQLKEYEALDKWVGGLPTITAEKRIAIAEKMVEMDRANHTAGRSDTQTTNQLMTLSMLTDSPYRRLRQCLAQIDRKRSALEEAYFKMQKKAIKIAEWREKGDALSLVKIQEAEVQASRQKMYIEGAFKEIAVFQASYDEIRASNSIPEKWDESDSEAAEIDHHIRQAFRQAHRDMCQGGRITGGNMEYMEQFGIHIQTAQAVIADYINYENQQIEKGLYPTVEHLYAFLDRMVKQFSGAHKAVLKHMGIEKLVKDEFLYLENR
jgi:type III secretion system FlhB-like substrate exporter